MSNSNSPFRIQAVQDANDSRTYNFSILRNGKNVGEGYSLLWDFGDGQDSEDLFPEHTYSESNKRYLVNCKVIRNDGKPEPPDTNDPGNEPDPPPEEIET